jgi:hypothetical protein
MLHLNVKTLLFLDSILTYAVEADEQNDGAMYGKGEIRSTSQVNNAASQCQNFAIFGFIGFYIDVIVPEEGP